MAAHLRSMDVARGFICKPDVCELEQRGQTDQLVGRLQGSACLQLAVGNRNAFDFASCKAISDRTSIRGSKAATSPRIKPGNFHFSARVIYRLQLCISDYA